ncbi:MAG: NUDIX domain-containing protein [Bacteroidota bacterium]|nr:NUDIX domain-containing protein [Bacteroidota bacterium]
MPKKSAGILLYRIKNDLPEVLLVHPGGPFWTKKDLGAWSIPKGEVEPGEDFLEAARREVKEETGIHIRGKLIELTPVKQKSGKIIYAWTAEGDFNVAEIKSNTFELEWPPHSGKKKAFPEIDKAAWFHLNEARKKIVAGQEPLIKELELKFTV